MHIIYYLFFIGFLTTCYGRSLFDQSQVLQSNTTSDKHAQLSRIRRTVAIKYHQWSNNVIPYEISDKFDEKAQLQILDAMRTIEHNVSNCIQFRPKKSQDKFYLKIQKGAGCSSTIGQTRGSVITLDDYCFDKRVLLHELMHSLGFGHEHNRPDRDKYVQIFPSHIQPNATDQFESWWWFLVDTFDLPYDYESILHYYNSTFSIQEGLPVMIATNNSSVRIGPRAGLSSSDIKAIRRYYKCETYESKYNDLSFGLKEIFWLAALLCCCWSICYCCIIFPLYVLYRCTSHRTGDL